MTNKEKADELIETYKFSDIYFVGGKETMLLNARNCALLCVGEMIEVLEHNHWQNKDWINHYKEVKKEIEKADISNYMRISE
jgi:hypothetical protein